MANRVHGIVQQAKHFDRARFCRFTDLIQHEVPALSAAPCHVKCHQALRDAVALLRTSDMRSISESLDGALKVSL